MKEYNRTFFSIVIEFFLRLIHYNNRFKENTFEKYLENSDNKKIRSLQKKKIKNKLSVEKIEGSKVYSITSENNSNYKKIVVYIHGGGFIDNVTSFHVNMLDKLASNVNAKIYIPIYPLLPKHTYKDTFKLLENVYNKLLEEKKEIILMGDSAGGTLSISFTEFLKEKNRQLPSKLILISPWVDVTMENKEIIQYEKKDPILSIYGLKKIGKLWADDLDNKNYIISPTYGDLNHLPPILLTVGTWEILYPDIMVFYNKLIKHNNEVELIVGNKMNHIFPLFPTIEAKKVLKDIYIFINK